MVILLVTGLKFVWTTSQRVRVIGAQVPVSAQYLFKGIRKCFLRCLVYYIYIFKYTKIDNVMNLHYCIAQQKMLNIIFMAQTHTNMTLKYIPLFIPSSLVLLDYLGFTFVDYSFITFR